MTLTLTGFSQGLKFSGWSESSMWQGLSFCAWFETDLTTENALWIYANCCKRQSYGCLAELPDISRKQCPWLLHLPSSGLLQKLLLLGLGLLPSPNHHLILTRETFPYVVILMGEFLLEAAVAMLVMVALRLLQELVLIVALVGALGLVEVEVVMEVVALAELVEVVAESTLEKVAVGGQEVLGRRLIPHSVFAQAKRAPMNAINGSNQLAPNLWWCWQSQPGQHVSHQSHLAMKPFMQKRKTSSSRQLTEGSPNKKQISETSQNSHYALRTSWNAKKRSGSRFKASSTALESTISAGVNRGSRL